MACPFYLALKLPVESVSESTMICPLSGRIAGCFGVFGINYERCDSHQQVCTTEGLGIKQIAVLAAWAASSVLHAASEAAPAVPPQIGVRFHMSKQKNTTTRKLNTIRRRRDNAVLRREPRRNALTLINNRQDAVPLAHLRRIDQPLAGRDQLVHLPFSNIF